MSRRTSLIVSGTLIVSSALALLAGTASAVAASSAAASDAQITDRVAARLAESDPSGASRLQVTTKDGVVTLSGHAGSGLAALKAVQVARHVEGVTKVQDHVVIMQ